jgi:hypothetical protein
MTGIPGFSAINLGEIHERQERAAPHFRLVKPVYMV